MKKPKSQRRWIRGCSTPTVSKGGTYYNPKLKFEVHPFGEPEKAVTFELDFWQFREMRNAAKDIAKHSADQARREAAMIDEVMEVQR